MSGKPTPTPPAAAASIIDRVGSMLPGIERDISSVVSDDPDIAAALESAAAHATQARKDLSDVARRLRAASTGQGE